MNLLKAIFGSANDRFVKSLQPLVVKINSLESGVKNLSDHDLKAKTEHFKGRLAKGESLDSILPEAFAVVREAGKRVLNMRHFDVQLIGGIVLHRGMIAEMRTGEGKTLVATLSSYLNALSGKGVHVVTVNDYLAKRDAEWMGQIHRFLGLSVGVIYSGMREHEKKSAYAADITYGQNNEFGFDYLRDNLKFSVDNLVQRGHNYAIVDEVDSILIDEARTPLIISGQAEDSSKLYHLVNKAIPKLKSEAHFEIDLKSKSPTLTEAGVAEAEKILEVANLYDPANIELLHHLNQSLKAHTSMQRDVDYVVRGGQVIIVDEFTGRLMPGRRWSDGLHQAIEAKENVPVAKENRTLASITFQNLFRMYGKLSGMTGTAATEAAEFKTIYKLNVITIPTNLNMIRRDLPDVIFRTGSEKYTAVVDEIEEVHQTGQPLLIGTISIEQSEALSEALKERRVPHNVLNAKHHEKEAEIVAQAGRLGAITIATNMAGRGTDIVLGGNPEGLAAREAKSRSAENPEYIQALEHYKALCAEEKQKVLAAGGLYIIGTERHESRRIDNQLRGRAGRQGDPGKSRFYISLEDDLMKRFGGEKLQDLMKKFGWSEGISIDSRILSKRIEAAQQRVERYHFEARKHVTDYDDVLNKQRQVIYNLRNKALHRADLRSEIINMIEDEIEENVLTVCNEAQPKTEWKLDILEESFKFLFNTQIPGTLKSKETQAIFDELRNQVKGLYHQRAAEHQAHFDSIKNEHSAELEGFQVSLSEEGEAFDYRFETIEQETLLSTLDHYWNMHLQQMEYLREGIGLRGYGQQNPLIEYQKEGFALFSDMLVKTRREIIRKLYYFEGAKLKDVLKRLFDEYRRRKIIQEQMNKVSEAQKEESNSVETYQPVTPDEAKAKMQELKKLRRKMRG